MLLHHDKRRATVRTEPEEEEEGKQGRRETVLGVRIHEKYRKEIPMENSRVLLR